jgi:hypothetical protein
MALWKAEVQSPKSSHWVSAQLPKSAQSLLDSGFLCGFCVSGNSQNLVQRICLVRLECSVWARDTVILNLQEGRERLGVLCLRQVSNMLGYRNSKPWFG